eukprot:m.492979 g.492979  ORF g.492979 m.492979 type:complete len:60 (+) comp117653_c0_seq1:181-360(+)
MRGRTTTAQGSRALENPATRTGELSRCAALGVVPKSKAEQAIITRKLTLGIWGLEREGG